MMMELSEIIIDILKSIEMETRLTIHESEYRLKIMLNKLSAEGIIDESN